MFADLVLRTSGFLTTMQHNDVSVTARKDTVYSNIEENIQDVCCLGDTNTEVSFDDVSEKDEEEEDEEEDFSFFKAPRQKKILLFALAMCNFCATTCYSLLATFYPKEAGNKGASQTITGLIFGCYELVAFLTAPIYGNFLATIGVKFMFISGVFVAGVCTVLFGFLDKSPNGTPFIVLSFVTRSFESLGATAYCTAELAIISRSYPKHVTTVFGILETFTGFGFMAGPALGSLLYSAGGFGTPFFVMGGLLLVCSFAIPFILPKINDEGQEKSSKSVFYLLKSPLCVLACIITVIGAIGVEFLEPVYADRLSVLKISTIMIGVLFLINSATYAIGAPLWGWIGDTKDINKGLLLFGNIATGFICFLLGPAPFFPFFPFTLWSQIVSLILDGFFIGAAIIPTYNIFMEGALTHLGMEDNYNTHGMISGLYTSMWSLGAFLGPMGSGYFVEHFGFEAAATGCGGLFELCGLLIFVYMLYERFFGHFCKNSRHEQAGYELFPLISLPKNKEKDSLGYADDNLETLPYSYVMEMYTHYPQYKINANVHIIKELEEALH